MVPAEEDEVIRLLAAAETALQARRLTSPVGNNAWEKYQAVLKLDSGNPEAMAGMERVIESYMELFRAAVEQEELDNAAGYLARVRELHPDSPALQEGEQRLAAARQAREDRMAEQERQRLEAARQTELDRQRQEARAKARELAGEMIAIPGGTFRMGDLNGGGDDVEKPVHSVTVPAFRMGKYEVTFAQWDACVADGGCGGYQPEDEGFGRADRSVINVSWNDVQGYIDWLNNKTGENFRLPTEAEWEYAARAGSTSIYSWGNDIGQNRANCDENCNDRWENTAPVGSFSANDWGLHDMHGNVEEWVQDCYNESYIRAPTDGSAWTSSGDCNFRVCRGDGWNSFPQNLRSAARFGEHVRIDRASHLGFRLAQDN